MDRIQTFIHKYSPEAVSLLEIGCGTGNVLSGLNDIYDVEGIDISKSMLNIAKKKHPKIIFHHQDMSTMKLQKYFDVIFSVYDSINHLLNKNQWKNTFDSVRRHLNSKGIFIFDINTIGRVMFLSTLDSWTQKIKDGNVSLIIRPKTGNIYSWKFTFKNGNEISETIIDELILPINEIMTMLEKEFDILAVENEKGEPGSDESKRVYFVCRRRI